MQKVFENDLAIVESLPSLYKSKGEIQKESGRNENV